jgi:cation-transporting ATPase E
MPSVVKEGRRVINNIAKTSSLYLMKTLCTFLLSVATIIGYLLNDALFTTYPFIPRQLLLLEMFVIGLPSIALAMQPNHERIKGNFIGNVINKSIPSALALFVSVMAVIFFTKGQPPEYVSSLAVIAFTATGFVILFKLCMPFNVLRTVMFGTCLTLCLIAVILAETIGGFFGLEFPNKTIDLLFLIIVVQASYFVLSFLTVIGNYLNVAARQTVEIDQSYSTNFPRLPRR